VSGEVQAAAVLGGLGESEQLDAKRPVGPARPRRIGLGDWLLPAYAVIAFVFLLIPIAYTFVFSFNDSVKSNIAWRGITFDKWLNVCNVEGGAVCEAFGNSIVIGLVATVIATTLGTMIAIAIVRYRFRARSAISLLLFLPMATPEVVLGSGLGSQFLNVGVDKGVATTIIAHIMFCISFVVITVRARVASLDPAIEEAGRDLYATPAQVWWRITFPLLLPGIVAAALLSFALSFDDFIITAFVSGNFETFPKYIYTAAVRAIPAQANVFASIIFLLAIVVVLATQLSAAVRRRRLAREG